MKIQIKDAYIMESDVEVCVYDTEHICNGLFCKPHPCVYFLREFIDISDEKYWAMKQYSVIGDVAIRYKDMPRDPARAESEGGESGLS